ncbi:response regulator transcription factor [[Clostridium] spiroforme]|nr:response regulator transcription factor [Thomasclavelia spiroformis]MBM6880964.1 response regulator transcription factor [Thomasclavelia spiroformis]
MNIFIAEDNLQDYLYLRRIIEKWSKWRNEPIHIYYHNELYYQLPRHIDRCDIAFVDIHMPVIDGISFCTYLRKYNQNIEIVFQSHSVHYGVESYRLKALGYLSKPVETKDIYRFLDSLCVKKHQCLIYKKQSMIRKIKFENILYIQVKKHSCYIHCFDHVESCYSSLQKIKTLLDQRFKQCYRSYIVNVDYISVIESDRLILFDNSIIPLSSAQYGPLKKCYVRQNRYDHETVKS